MSNIGSKIDFHISFNLSFLAEDKELKISHLCKVYEKNGKKDIVS